MVELCVRYIGVRKINISDYESLLEAARQQAEPQLFLFVFLETSLPKDHKGEEESNFLAGQGGALQPVMCVDKALDELGSFSELVEESKQMGQAWDLVLVAILSGSNGTAPKSDAAEAALKKMVETVQHGGDLSKYMAFAKSGDPIQFG